MDGWMVIKEKILLRITKSRNPLSAYILNEYGTQRDIFNNIHNIFLKKNKFFQENKVIFTIIYLFWE